MEIDTELSAAIADTINDSRLFVEEYGPKIAEETLTLGLINGWIMVAIGLTLFIALAIAWLICFRKMKADPYEDWLVGVIILGILAPVSLLLPCCGVYTLLYVHLAPHAYLLDRFTGG